MPVLVLDLLLPQESFSSFPLGDSRSFSIVPERCHKTLLLLVLFELLGELDAEELPTELFVGERDEAEIFSVLQAFVVLEYGAEFGSFEPARGEAFVGSRAWIMRNPC